MCIRDRFRFEELGKLLIKKIEYLQTHGRENEVDAIMEEYKLSLIHISWKCITTKSVMGMISSLIKWRKSWL